MAAVNTLPASWSWPVALAEAGEQAEDILSSMLRRSGRWLLVVEDARQRYVQLLVDGDGGIFAEAVSNNDLSGPDCWSEADEERLTRLGWEPPCLPARPNWNCLFSKRRPDVAHVSALLMCTLRDPFGLEDTDLLVFSVRRSRQGEAKPPA